MKNMKLRKQSILICIVFLCISIFALLSMGKIVLSEEKSLMSPEEEKTLKELYKPQTPEEEKVINKWLEGLQQPLPYEAMQSVLTSKEEEIFGKICERLSREDEEKIGKIEVRITWERLVISDHGNFSIKGEVMDEKGNKLDGVNVFIAKSKMTKPFEEPKYEEEKHVINGSFNFEVKNYSDINLTFAKEGYYKKDVDFDFQPAKSNPAGIQFRKEGKTLIVDNLQVVLEEIGKVVELIEFSKSLRYTPSGKGSIVDFEDLEKIKDAEELEQSPSSKWTHNVENIEDAKQLPEHCLYIMAKKDEKGNIKVVDLKARLLEEIRIRMNSSEDGFIIYEPKREDRKFYREMNEAPEGGYKQEIVLHAEDMERFRNDNDIFFYFKVKGKYGKGCISNIDYERGDDDIPVEVWVSVELRIQPDGSRYLRTMD